MGRAICWSVVLVGIGVSAAASAGAPVTVVINEVDYDQVAIDTAEFIELKNDTGGDVDLSTYAIELRSSAAATIYKTIALDPVVLPSGGYYVVCSNAVAVANCDLDVSPDTNLIQNGPIDVVVLLDGAAIVDVLNYVGQADPPYFETVGFAGADDASAGIQSLSRFPDGQDTNNNSLDFSKHCSTPGATNSVDVACPPVCDNGVIEPGEQCDDGPINGTTASCCDAVCQFQPVVTACGSATIDDCTAADTCNGAGACDANDVTDATPCTDDGVECTGDVCGTGVCTHPNLGAGVACGDGSDDDCLNPDTCDGAGVCQSNDEGDGTACTDDGVQCTDDVCGSGVCTHPDSPDDSACASDSNDCTDDVCSTGACTHPTSSAGTACGSSSNTDCTDPDTCDAAGSCQSNDASDGASCADNELFCDGDESCSSGVCESAGDPCDTSVETCNEGDRVCDRPPCGDGVVAEDEQCDDFNFDDGDGCTNCRVDQGWVCGDDTPPDGTSDCYETCGNGALDTHEGCDDANAANGDGCSDNCVVEDGYECVENGAGADTCTPVCGDGIVLDGERCDDGNADPDDGCTGCTVAPGYFCDTQEPSVCAVFESDTGCSCRLGGRGRGGRSASLLLLALFALRGRRRNSR